MIWEEALPGPRIVYLEPITRPNFTYFPVRSDIAIDDYDEDGYSRFFDTEREIDIETAHKLRNEGDRVQGEDNDLKGIRTRAPPPVLLYVCRESFQVTCKHYERVFGTKSTFPEVWFNFEIDTLYLDWGWPIALERHYWEGWFVQAELEKVKYLALYIDFNMVYACRFDGEEEPLAMWLPSFPNVKKVTLNRLKSCHTMGDSGTLVFTDPPSPDMRFYVHHHDYFGDKDVRLNFYNAYTPDTEVNLQKLEKWRLEEYWVTDPSLLPPLPELDYRMITTPRINAELSKAEAEWREEMRTLGPIRTSAVVGYVID
jgi:hypothetical protein